MNFTSFDDYNDVVILITNRGQQMLNELHNTLNQTYMYCDALTRQRQRQEISQQYDETHVRAGSTATGWRRLTIDSFDAKIHTVTFGNVGDTNKPGVSGSRG